MKTAMLCVQGNWAHFKKPETNNNPLTHDFLTKTALIGMIGAVLGKEREVMKGLFPRLSDDLQYGVALLRPVKKQTWSFTLRRFAADRSKLEVTTLSPRPFEFLRKPSFKVVLGLADDRSEQEFNRFLELIAESKTHYDPVLGLHNCPAEIALLKTGKAEAMVGHFRTEGFVPRSSSPDPVESLIRGAFRLGFDRLPTYQDNAMWNPPDRYVEVIYPDRISAESPSLLSGKGAHFKVDWDSSEEDCWCLI